MVIVVILSALKIIRLERVMYSHVSKSVAVSQNFFRRVLRTATGIPGMVIDGIVSLFWLPNPAAYWEASNVGYFRDPDGGNVDANFIKVGFMQGLFGWIGEILGYAIGYPVGILVGGAAYIVDRVLLQIRQAQRVVYAAFERFAQEVGRAPITASFIRALNPANYVEKSWNVGSVVIGTVIAFAPWAVARLVEFIIPGIEHRLSRGVSLMASVIGGGLLCVGAITAYPVVHVFQKAMDLYFIAREKIRYGVAVIYAKTGTIPDPEHAEVRPTRGGTGSPAYSIHSPEFRREVEATRNLPWARLLFGPGNIALAAAKQTKSTRLDAASLAQALPTALKVAAGAEDDPITLESIATTTRPLVMDPHGHVYIDYRGTGTQGIHSILSDPNKVYRCPVNRGDISAEDLLPYVRPTAPPP
jgi:hypothetical protein